MNSRACLLVAFLVLLLGTTALAQKPIGPISTSPAAPNMVAPATPATAASMPSTPSTPPPDLLIGSGDLLEVSVYDAPDFDHKEARVSNSGDIVLPLIGAQQVAKLTAAQAQALIADKLTRGQFFNNPQVTVFVKEYATQGISVLGEVQKPGVYPVLGPRRLFDVISQAGGLTPKAGKAVTVSHSDDPNHPERVKLAGNLENTVEGNVPVRPGDTVVVSKAGIVYVVGDVKLPGGFVMENDSMTVLQAVALAQGPLPTAALDKTKLIRRVNAQQQETPIELKKIFRSQQNDLKLQADDILFIPNSAGKSAARRSLDVALQAAVGVAIYH
jgi:polysaccharide export outer membrane protein